MFQNILVPVDFSGSTDDLLRFAREIARKFDSTVHLLHVVPDIDYFTPYESFVAAENMVAARKGIENEAERDLRGLQDKLSGIPTKTAIRTGAAYVEIIDYVKSQNIDLIVMGTHGRGVLEHLLIGSVTEKVVRKAPCPVLTIRTSKTDFKQVAAHQM